ncbi:conserved hypothetical protein [Natranaerobius thermophilus JW/NM-WN-LF]|uniref:Uncharacterized protein n=1 Tax=Natranaerobius thermophilus (strain ATCC BAA-1301 / DSM 18059 / JW/NM-WN-LF) TaxID=457570 RepID=B2A893_NATTJ|nr:conserved hypothetical protein [Natranaerobius thermophilus JW/NM-WN-LF]
MFFQIAGIIIVSLIICLIEVPDMLTNKQWGELVTFFVLLLSGTVLLIFHLF